MTYLQTRNKRFLWSGSTQYLTYKIVGGGGGEEDGMGGNNVFGNIYLNYLKRQRIKNRRNASEGSACTDALVFAIVFSLDRGEWFPLDVFAAI